MPEAVKEVVTEVPQSALKENSPDKLPCKEVKPAEASSGTLPLDEEPSKDSGEGAVAPDLGQGEAPEQGKSESSDNVNDVPLEEGTNDPKKEIKEGENNPSEEVKDNSADEKGVVSSDSVDTRSKSENSNDNEDKELKNPCKEQHLVEESKETSDESLSQESKQTSPEECGIEESKQASPEESKTEGSMETETSNDQEPKSIKETQLEDNMKENEAVMTIEEKNKNDKSEKSNAEQRLKDQEDERSIDMKEEEKDESMDTNEKDVNKKVINDATEKVDLIPASSENKESQGESMEKTGTSTDIVKETEIDVLTPLKEKKLEQEPIDADIKKEEATEQLSVHSVEGNIQSGDAMGTTVQEDQECKTKELACTVEESNNHDKKGPIEEKEKQQNRNVAPISENKSEKLKESLVPEGSRDEVKNVCLTSENGQMESSVEKPPANEPLSIGKEKCDNESADSKVDVSADSKADASVDCTAGVPKDSGIKVADGTDIAEEDTDKKEGNVDDKQENGDGSGRSKEIDVETAEEVKQQMREGKSLLVTGDYFTAADILGKACEAAGKLYGDLANENAELYYLYGCAMLECAKNENNVLGEGVKNKDEEDENQEAEVADVNGEEQMETEENVDEEEEKMAVDGDETGDDKQTVEDSNLEKKDTEQQSSEDESKKNMGTKENNEEEEEDSSLKVAWEMFELAKIAFTRIGNEERLADTYIKLAEVGIESGHQTALDDMKAGLELRKKCCSENPRIISETHFNLGLGFATFEMFDEAIEQFKISKSLLEAKIDSLLKIEEQKAQEEIKDIKELLPDLDEKILDMQDSKETKFKQTQNGEKTSSDDGESSKPVSNISHLVKRKRKLEDVASDLLPNTKQPCTEKIPETDESAK